MNSQRRANGFCKAILFTLLGVSTMAHSIEEPQYRVIESLGSVEIRYYEPAIQAVTTLAGSSQTSEGFRRLAGFIFGGNEQQQNIAMTAPVQETLGTALPEMAFTMPAEYALEDLPQPKDDRVSFQTLPARAVAAVSFSGWATAPRVARFERELRATLESSDIEITGDAVLNQYNPPWTLPFLRRNEITIDVKQASLKLARERQETARGALQTADTRFSF